MKKAVILLNMGGARSKGELREFLKNMFLDKRIIRSPFRFILSPLITAIRLNEAWKNYELIGGSQIYKHTQNLTEKLSYFLGENYDVFFAMRYTTPKISEVLADKHYDEILLFPMYPHFSSATTLSSFDDADIFFKGQSVKVHKIEHFFDDERFNDIIVDSIKKRYDKDTHLIFSAHSLPLSIAQNDSYETHIKAHIKILSKRLADNGLIFKGIHLAFQSRLGPIKWLEPSIGEVLRHIAPDPAIVYPISFTIDNSETDFELGIFYKEIAKKFGINIYEVCEAQNDSDKFVKYINDKITDIF